jgi:oxalate---CoA ligase
MTRDQDLLPTHHSVRSLLEDRAARRGHAPYLISSSGERTLTYAELLVRVTTWRCVLRSSGVNEGARIGIVIADPLDFATALLAVLCDGSWAAPLDPTFDVTNYEAVRRRTAELSLDAVLCDRVVPRTVVPVIVMSEDRDATKPKGPTVPPSSPGGIVLSSSGTTGTPKVMALGEGQLVHAATTIARHNRLSNDDRGFNPLPLWHVNAEVVGLLATLVAGAAVVLDDRFHRTDFWRTVDDLKVTWINAVPAIISRIAEVREGESVPSRLRFVRSASAPLAPALMTSFQNNTGAAIVESYGMTEAASQICVNPLDGPRKPGSVGPAVGVELRIVPFDDSEALDHSATTTPGQVEIRGPSVITEYDTPGYEDRFDSDGWLQTGDLGYLDDDGYLFLVGRSDDVINRGGEKILPREIEDVVLGSPRVVAAAVVGVAHDVYGQVPVLYVQFVPTESRTDLDDFVRELVALLQTSLVRARRPARLIVVESFPTHATGKIRKKSLATTALSVIVERELA